MAKILQEYVKYTTKELELYTATDSSCVRRINTNLHLLLGPCALADFKHALIAHLGRKKVGYYDKLLDGIVLDIKNIKVLGRVGALRADDARIHVDINADCYVFRPLAGAVLCGTVKHIGNHHVGVIIYRVFNASIRFEEKLNEEDVQMEQELQFRIKNFDLQNVFPYIEGERLLQTPDGQKSVQMVIKCETEKNDNSAVDSGIEEKEAQEDDESNRSIKEEQFSETEIATDKSKNIKKGTKRKRKCTQPTEVEAVQVKVESKPKKRKNKDNSQIY